MKLEYLDDISAGGKYKDVVSDKLVRLYDFDNSQAEELQQIITKQIVDEKKTLEINKLKFVVPLNCTLTLRLSNHDIGITTTDKKNFLCDLTINGYITMINLLEPFCNTSNDGYQWLYDTDADIDFLFSPGGGW